MINPKEINEKGGFRIHNQYGLYFLTFTVVGWVDMFTRLECKEIFIESLKYCQKDKGLNVFAYVIMSNHVHLILSANENSSGLSDIVRDLKRYTANKILNWINNEKESRRKWMKVVFKFEAKYKAENKIFQFWQRGNHPEELYFPRFSRQKLGYIHENPVRAGIVSLPEDYVFSSARNYAGREDVAINVDLLDFGAEEGFVFT